MTSIAYANVRKLANIVDIVADFGADPTGVALSTTALTNAVGSGDVRITLPAGTFLINPIIFTGKNNVWIDGAGIEATKIALSGAGTALTFSNCQWLRMTNLSVRVNGTPQAVSGTVGVRLDTGSANAEFERVSFVGFHQDGLQLVGTSGTPLSGNKVENCYFLGNGNRQLYSFNNNDFHISDNQFGRLAGITKAAFGAYLEESSAGNYEANYHWDNGVACAFSSSNYNTVASNRFEESDTNGFIYNGGSQVVFTDNKVHTNSQLSTGAHDGAYFASVDGLIVTDNLAFSFTATTHRWAVNVDTGCTNVTVENNKLKNYAAGFGPVRVVGSIAIPPNVDQTFSFNSGGTVAAASTVFIGASEAQATETNASTLTTRKGTVARMYVGTAVAPGSGQTFTYTLRVNGVDTAMVVTVADTATAGAAWTATPAVLVGPDDAVTVKLVTSAGAAATAHRVAVSVVEY